MNCFRSRFWCAIMILPLLAAMATPIAAVGIGPDPAAVLPGLQAHTLFQRVDTFPRCAEQRRCWRDGSGRLRCGLVSVCQECKWVRRCDRQTGCAWREVCKWGPYKPPLPTN